MIDKGIPRQHYPILNEAGEKIGEVTSGTMAPTLKKAVGMGYVKNGYWDPENEIYIEVRGKALKAKIVKTPFYQK
jgi:aminomethyltransferase